MSSDFYSVRRFDGKTDLNGKDPYLRIICNNRTSGKTTSVGRECIDAVVNAGEEFFIVFRKKYEIANAHHALDSAIALWKKETGQLIETTSKKMDGDIYATIFFDGKPAGYAIPMKSVDEIKKYSNQFCKTTIGFMDEFQLESGDYMKIRDMTELEIMQSIISSVSRGLDNRARKIIFYLIGNNVSNVNPYYHGLGIYKRLKSDTKWMRGDGWILDCERNEQAAADLEKNELLKAFGSSKYLSFACGKNTLFDKDRFITKKIEGKSRYIATLLYEGKSYGIREFFTQGIVFVSEKTDSNCKNVYAVTPDDMGKNLMLYSRASNLFRVLNWAYTKGILFFDGIGARNAAYECLAISLYS